MLVQRTGDRKCPSEDHNGKFVSEDVSHSTHSASCFIGYNCRGDLL